MKTFCLACLRPCDPGTADLCILCSVYWVSLDTGCGQCSAYRAVLEERVTRLAKQRSGAA